MKILFATNGSANDIEVWSGSVVGMLKALKSAGADLVITDNLPFQVSLDLRLHHKMRQMLSKRIHYLQAEQRILKVAAKVVENKFHESKADVVFFPNDGAPVYSCMPPEIPSYCWMDAFKHTWIDHYWGLDAIDERSRENIKQSDIATLTICRKIFISSNWAKQSALAQYGDIVNQKCEIVPLGGNIDSALSKAEVDSLIDTRLSSPIKFLFLGVEWERKGGNECLSFIKSLRSKGVDAQLHVVGLKNADFLKTDKSVITHGFIHKGTAEGKLKFKKLLSESAFLLFFSKAEAFGLAPCEASAHGVPTLARYVGGLSEVIAEGRNGFLFESTDINEAALTTLKCINNKSAYRSLAMSSLNEYNERLNWGISGALILDKIKKDFSQS